MALRDDFRQHGEQVLLLQKAAAGLKNGGETFFISIIVNDLTDR